MGGGFGRRGRGGEGVRRGRGGESSEEGSRRCREDTILFEF